MTADTLVNETEQQAVDQATGAATSSASAADMQQKSVDQPDIENMGTLLDIDMKLTVELGRTRMRIRDIMELSPGSIVELGKSPSEPVDIMVNGVLTATGEVVVVDDHFAVRVTRLIDRLNRSSV
jgi:flagellar motor switch protein FliN